MRKICLESENLDPSGSSVFYHLWELIQLMNFPEFHFQLWVRTAHTGSGKAIMNLSLHLLVQQCYICSLKLGMVGRFISWKPANTTDRADQDFSDLHKQAVQ